MAKKNRANDGRIELRCRSEDLKAFRAAASREGRSVANWMLKQLRPASRHQSPREVRASLKKALAAVDAYDALWKEQGEPVDAEEMKTVLTEGYESLVDLWEALGECPTRDEAMERLYQGLCVLHWFWSVNSK